MALQKHQLNLKPFYLPFEPKKQKRGGRRWATPKSQETFRIRGIFELSDPIFGKTNAFPVTHSVKSLIHLYFWFRNCVLILTENNKFKL